MSRLILILGGVRSGKSRFGLELAARLGGDNVLFVATAAAGDDEMARRIAVHRQSRPAGWPTLEQALDVGAALADVGSRHAVVLLDCLTLLVSNRLLASGDRPCAETAERDVRAEIDSLISYASQFHGTIIVVSGEVGMGLVPENPLGRLFRDLLGWANQRLAAAADETYLMVAGLPIELKALANATVGRISNLAEKPDN